MAVTVADQGTASDTSTTTVARSPLSNIAAGSLIAVLVQESGVAAGTLADSAGNTYVLRLSGAPNGSTSNGFATLWVCEKCKALTTAQTITYSKNLGLNGVAEMAVLSQSGDLLTFDKAATVGTGSSASASAGPISPSDGSLVLGGLGLQSTSATNFNTNPGSFVQPFTFATQAGGGKGVRGGNIVAAGTGAVTYNPTSGASRAWVAFLIAFKSASVAATGASATAGAGSLVSGTQKTLSGAAAASAAGVLTPHVTVSPTLALAGAAAASAAGVLTPAVVRPSLTGAAAASAAGSLATPSLTLTFSGVAAASAAGALIPAVHVFFLAGAAAAAAAGNLTGAVSLVGAAAVSAAGTFASIGNVLFGAEVVSAAGLFSLSSSSSAVLTGVEAVSAAGALVFVAKVELPGAEAPTRVGVFGVPISTPSFVGVAAAATAGVLAGTNTPGFAGAEVSAVAGIVAPTTADLPLLGAAAATSTGDFFMVTAGVGLTGVSAQVSAGALVPSLPSVFPGASVQAVAGMFESRIFQGASMQALAGVLMAAGGGITLPGAQATALASPFAAVQSLSVAFSQTVMMSPSSRTSVAARYSRTVMQ